MMLQVQCKRNVIWTGSCGQINSSLTEVTYKVHICPSLKVIYCCSRSTALHVLCLCVVMLPSVVVLLRTLKQISGGQLEK